MALASRRSLSTNVSGTHHVTAASQRVGIDHGAALRLRDLLAEIAPGYSGDGDPREPAEVAVSTPAAWL
jgi:hypothetical protein